MRPGATRWNILAIAVACCALGLSYAAQTLVPHWNGNRLQVTTAGLHFLTGKALERLHDGAAVPYAFRLTLSSLPRTVPLQRSFDRFIVSYDVWGEKFKVAQSGGTRNAVANLAASAAEMWCVNQMGVPSGGAPFDQDLWLHLEIRAEDPMPQSHISDTGFTLSALIKIFSEPARVATQEWNAETAPFRLNNLRPQ